MKDSIILTVPYPVKFMGVSFMKKRKIGFLFTNRAKAVMYDIVKSDGCKTASEYEKKYGMPNLINQMLYSSAVAYCMDPFKKVKQNFTNEKLIVAISMLSKQEQERLLNAMKEAQEFGIKPEKKKLTKTTTR